MSEWYEVKDADFIELSDDKKFVQILFNTTDHGNCYVEFPVEMLVKLYATYSYPCAKCEGFHSEESACPKDKA